MYQVGVDSLMYPDARSTKHQIRLSLCFNSFSQRLIKCTSLNADPKQSAAVSQLLGLMKECRL
jgi:hypothetical protein